MNPKPDALTIGQALTEASNTLTQVTASPRLEAELLLAHTLDRSRTHLFAWPDKPLSGDQAAAYRELVNRRGRGEPVAYITGHREFWSLELETTPDTLIPRPETELLVERALELLPRDLPQQAADLGTGTGAIAIAIASERPQTQLLACDLSPATLEVAQRNILRHQLTNISTSQGDWFQALPKELGFDLLISNPPYIPNSDPHLKQGGLPWEPQGALIAGTDGLDDIRTLTSQSRAHLNPGGHLLIEHGYDQGPSVQALFKQAGFRAIKTHQDLEARDRMTEGQQTRE